METALTALIWAVVGLIGLSVIVYIIAFIVGVVGYKKISKQIDRDFNDPFFRTGRPKF